MSNCKSKDCPAPTIEYKNLYRLPDGLNVCQFCFARLSVKTVNDYKTKSIKAPPEDLIRIPPVNKNKEKKISLSESSTITTKSLVLNDIDLGIWEIFLRELSKIIGHYVGSLETVSQVLSPLAPIILTYTNKSQLLVAIKEENEKTNDFMLILKSFFSFSISDPIKVPLKELSELYKLVPCALLLSCLVC